MPAVSVIVPAYNAAQTLRRCVRSILGQSLHDLELILADDGSSDSTPALCDAMARQDTRIRVLHLRGGGPAAARNAGLTLASGEYVGFADADDAAEPTLFSTLLTRARETDADLSLCAYFREAGGSAEVCGIFPGGDTVLERETLRTRVLPYFFGYAADELAHSETCCPFADRRSYVWLCLYRRALLEENNIRFPDEKQYYTEDNLFNLLAVAHAARAVYTARPLYRYTQAPESFTGRFEPAYLDCRLRKYAFLRTFAAQHGLTDTAATRLPRKACAELPTLVNYYASQAPGFREKLRGVARVLHAEDFRSALAAVPRAEWPRGRIGLTLALARVGAALPLVLACLTQRALRRARHNVQ